MATLPICTHVEVSWNGSGLFTGPYDDITTDVLGDPGVKIELGKDGSRTLSPPKVSAADFAVVNHDGQYSQERADSPVYQFVIPGRPVRISAQYGPLTHYDAPLAYDGVTVYDGVGTYALARTAIDTIAQTSSLGNQQVSISTLGLESLFVAGTVTVPIMTAPRVDQCITAILDAVGWPTGAARDISIADSSLTYWWCDARQPWAALMELLQSEGPGALWFEPRQYVPGGVVAHFENRNYRTTHARSTTSQATFYDRHGGAPTAYDAPLAYQSEVSYDGAQFGLWFTEMTYDPGFANIYNQATYSTNTRTLGALGVIWTYGAAVTLTVGQSVTLIAKPSDPFQNAVTPLADTDYTVVGGTVTVSLSASSGLVAFVTITATGGTPTVSGLQLRAQPLTVIGSTDVRNTVDTSSSIETFSPIPGQMIPIVLSVGGWPEISLASASAVCDAWVNRYMLQRPAVGITVHNVDDPHVLEILRRRVSDRITVSDRNSGLASDLWINSKEIIVSGAGGRVVAAVFGCEKVEEVGGSVWDTAVWDLARWGV